MPYLNPCVQNAAHFPRQCQTCGEGARTYRPPYVPPVSVLSDIKQNIQNQSWGSLPTKSQSPFHTLEGCAQRDIYRGMLKVRSLIGRLRLFFGSRVVLHTDKKIRRLSNKLLSEVMHAILFPLQMLVCRRGENAMLCIVLKTEPRHP